MLTISGIYLGCISLVLIYVGNAEANRYRLKDSFAGEDFFNGWTWETFQDPTHGRVNYVDQNAAIAKNLSFGRHLISPAPIRRILDANALSHLCSEG